MKISFILFQERGYKNNKNKINKLTVNYLNNDILNKAVRIIIPNYAKGRIKIYNLTEELVKDALRNPDEIVKGYERRLIAHKLLNEHILRVVYLKEEEVIKVVTVYPAKKERYWRKEK